MTRPLVVFGLGPLADSACDMLAASGRRPAAFTLDREYLQADSYAGVPLVAFEELERRFPPETHDLLLLIGYRRMRTRAELFARVKAKGYRLPGLIAASAHLASGVQLGENVIVTEFAFLGNDARLGDNVLVRPMTYIGHQSFVGDHTFIAPRVGIASRCRIGSLCYVGIGATVIDKVAIGDETLVAAGAVVISDCAAGTQMAGTPARKIGEHGETGILILR